MTPPVDETAALTSDDPIGADRPRSRAEEIKRRRAERQAGGGPVLKVVLPEGEFRVHYGRVNLNQIKAAAKNTTNGTAAAIKLLVAACKQVDMYDFDKDEWFSAAEETDKPQVPVCFDSRLVQAAALEPATITPRDILIAVYEANDVAIVSHGKRLSDWSTGADLDELDVEEVEDLAGEAGAET